MNVAANTITRRIDGALSDRRAGNACRFADDRLVEDFAGAKRGALDASGSGNARRYCRGVARQVKRQFSDDFPGAGSLFSGKPALGATCECASGLAESACRRLDGTAARRAMGQFRAGMGQCGRGCFCRQSARRLEVFPVRIAALIRPAPNFSLFAGILRRESADAGPASIVAGRAYLVGSIVAGNAPFQRHGIEAGAGRNGRSFLNAAAKQVYCGLSAFCRRSAEVAGERGFALFQRFCAFSESQITRKMARTGS